jgi:hypothetical protein
MHPTEEGLVSYLLEVIIDPLSDSQKKSLDAMAELLFSKSNNRSTQRTAYPPISFCGGFSSLTQLSGDEKVGKLFALCIVAETDAGRNILENRCDPSFDSKRKERANRFQEADDCSSVDEEEEQVPRGVPVEEGKEPHSGGNCFSKVPFDSTDDKHLRYVDYQLRKHGLSYIIGVIMQMGELHRNTTHSIVWNKTRSLIQNNSYRTIHVSIPNSDDETIPTEWKRVADRPPCTHSN